MQEPLDAVDSALLPRSGCKLRCDLALYATGADRDDTIVSRGAFA